MDYQDIIYTKEMASAFVRFPGGMDSNYYDWHSGQLELSVQPNSSETYRFFANLAEQIKRGHPEGTFIEPYISSARRLVPRLFWW